MVPPNERFTVRCRTGEAGMLPCPATQENYMTIFPGKRFKADPTRAGRVAARILACAIVVVLACSALFLSGCKFTNALTQHTENEQLGVLDETASPVYRDTANAPEDSTRTSSTISDSERVNDQDQMLPTYGADAPQGPETDIREQRTDSADTDNATTGNRYSYAEGDNDEAGDSTVAGEVTTGTDEGTGEGTSDTSDSGEGEPGDMQNLAGGIGGTGQTFDATGSDFELPEGVSTVATAGPYATVVEMLAGRGALVAADQEWIEEATKLGLFPGEGLEDMARGWSGDETVGYEPDIDAIIAADPDVVLVDNVALSFSDADTARLQAAGIDVVVMPRLGDPDTPDADITKAVSIAGELLSDAEDIQFDTAAMADTYVSLHDEVIDACLQANGGYSYKMVYGTGFPAIYQGVSDGGVETANLSSTRYTTAFIDSWTTDVHATSVGIRRYGNATLYLDDEEIDASEGAGLSATGSSKNFLVIDYYLQVSGVVNNSYEGIKPVSGGNGLSSDPYLVVPGGTRNLITPTTAVSSRATPSALWYSPSSLALVSNWICVGDASFPLLLVKTEDIAQRVVASANKVNGLYNVGKPYVVQVVPTGFSGSWADGTVESFLLSSWTAGLYKNDGDLSTCQSYTDRFYVTFYRCGSEGVVSDFNTALAALCTVRQ